MNQTDKARQIMDFIRSETQLIWLVAGTYISERNPISDN